MKNKPHIRFNFPCEGFTFDNKRTPVEMLFKQGMGGSTNNFTGNVVNRDPAWTTYLKYKYIGASVRYPFDAPPPPPNRVRSHGLDAVVCWPKYMPHCSYPHPPTTH